MGDNCFAVDKSGGCRTLTATDCGKCKFGRTLEQLQGSREAAYLRITQLEYSTQWSIAKTYYGGRMPWRE